MTSPLSPGPHGELQQRSHVDSIGTGSVEKGTGPLEFCSPNPSIVREKLDKHKWRDTL